MTQFTDLVIILPCHSLEDFPTHYTGADAADLLSCWTSLWNPALISGTQSMPQWMSADYGEPCWKTDDNEWTHPEEAAAETDETAVPLVILPNVAEPICSSEILMEAENDGLLITKIEHRGIPAIQAAEQSEAVQAPLAKIPEEIVNDFYALGYAFLQVQLMTRQLRYSSNLDLDGLEKAVVAAANAAAEGQPASSVEDLLITCFDLLLEEKNAYYSIEPNLCEIVLLGETTLGKSLATELESIAPPINFLINGGVARRLIQKHLEKAERIRQLVAEEQASLVGGMSTETPDWLMDRHGIARQLRRGCAELEEVFQQSPQVFMRFGFGVSPDHPEILSQLGFLGAVHCPIDRKGIPQTNAGVIRWEGPGEQSILTMGDRPLSASEPGNFLALAVKIGEMSDSSHSANVLLARWPGRTCQAYQDFRRIVQLSPLFGSFTTIPEILEAAYDPGYGESYTAAEYQPAYLPQVVKQKRQNPISRIVNYHRDHAKLESCRRVLCLVNATADCSKLATEIEAAETKVDENLVDETLTDHTSLLESLWERCVQLLQETHQPESTNASGSTGSIPTAFNLHSQKQMQTRQFPANSHTRVGFARGETATGPFASQTASEATWVFEAPGFGSRDIDVQQVESNNPFARQPPLAQDGRLQNEFFIANIDKTTGGIRSVGYHNQRINLLTQKLGMRIPSESGEVRKPSRYASMVAESIETLCQTPLVGSIRSTGTLVDGDQVVSRFTQTMTVRRGIPRIEIEFELDVKVPFMQNQNHYLCNRMAWKEEAATVIANAIESRLFVTGEWFHATKYIAVGDEDTFTLLTNGLPYHRRASRNMLDSILTMAGENQTRFRIAIEINQRYPMASALGHSLLKPTIFQSEPSKKPTDWQFHLSAKNVVVTRCDPMGTPGSDGIQMALLETEGRKADLKIRSRRPLMSATQVDFNGQTVASIEVEETNQLQLTLPPSGQTIIQLRFQA